MTNYFKCILAVVVLMACAAMGHAQVAPTLEQREYVTNLARRIRSKAQADVAALERLQQQAITAEQQAEGVQNGWVARSSVLAGRIECLNRLLRDYPRIRGNMDQAAMQQVNALRRELAQLTQQQRNVNTQLTQTTTALNEARLRRQAADRNFASGRAKNVQQIADLKYLYDLARMNPPQFPLNTMIERVTELGRERQLTSNVTISAGSTPVTVRYQLVSGGQEFSRANCTTCNVQLPVGNYNFWVVPTGSAEPRKTAHLIHGETQTIDITPNTSRR